MPVAPAIVIVIAVAPAAAVIAVVVAIAPEAPVILEGAALTQFADLRPAMFGLAAEKAVALDVPPELKLLVADAVEASVIAVAGLRRGVRQQDSADQHCPGQSCV